MMMSRPLQSRVGQRIATVAVAEEVKDSLFEPFSRSHGNQASGHRLGLFISRRLARAMDGDLQLVDDPGAGARFCLQFPLA